MSTVPVTPVLLKAPANPGPLGLLGFGLTTLALSAVNAGLLGGDSVSAIVPLAFAFGGVAQLIAGVAEYKNGNTFGMAAFTSFGLFWWWFALLNLGLGAKVLTPPAAHGVATILLLWGVLTFGLWLVTFRLSKAVWSIFLLLWVTFSCSPRMTLARLAQPPADTLASSPAPMP
jgi:succinate-acetate transporter protein